MRSLLAIDAGGSRTRAVVLDTAGSALGYGHSASGNPTSAGMDVAVSSIFEAAMQAVAAADMIIDGASSAVIALAGVDSDQFRISVRRRLAPLGFSTVDIESDLLGMFYSGTPVPDGYALIAGTGTVAAQISGGRLAQVSGGTGWLLGDAGGGFWIGHRVARAVVADLDGQGPATALTLALLAALDIPADSATFGGRPVALQLLTDALYDLRPVQLSRFAPLAFAQHEDPVAREILIAASSELAALLASVREAGDPAPVVIGGSVLVEGILAAATELQRHLVVLAEPASLIPVPDGVVGAAVLALRHAGFSVGRSMLDRINTGVRALRGPLSAERVTDR